MKSKNRNQGSADFEPILVHVRDLHAGPQDLKVNCSPEQIELADNEFRFTSPVRGTVRFSIAGNKVMAKGQLETEAISGCVRCLQPVSVSIKAPVDVIFDHDEELLKPELEFLGAEDSTIAYFDGETIKPEQQFRESIMLDLPPLPLCRPDCKGLCPQCGADLNSAPCNCDRKSQDIGWKSALKQIKLD
ncbi:MAG: DUF177 domain-containing protein [Candidatus Sumerlaeaceae bacterium]|nr:DUF177 domain-containing protein [Candidatus Sumerlaeaceae bacterium]